MPAEQRTAAASWRSLGLGGKERRDVVFGVSDYLEIRVCELSVSWRDLTE